MTRSTPEMQSPFSENALKTIFKVRAGNPSVIMSRGKRTTSGTCSWNQTSCIMSLHIIVEGVVHRSSLLNEWEPRVQDYWRSGLKAADWCELNGFSVHQLRYWVVKVNKLAKDAVSNPEAAKNSGLSKSGGQESGTTISGLSKAGGQKSGTKNSGLSKAGGQNVAFGWAEVEIADSCKSSGIAICIGAARIEVTSGFDKSLLSDVLQVVTGSC